MDLGLITFGSRLPDPATGEMVSQGERLREVTLGARAADEAGFAWFAVGEHHFGERDVIPSPAIVLAALAEATSRIRLATGTTLVANRDPVLLAEDYALVDQLSDGRLEMVAGASFFPAPYAVFDQDPASKSDRKRENLELLLRLWSEDRVTWQGRYRPPLDDVHVQPRLAQARPPVWVSSGVGSESVPLAVEHGLPMVVATTSKPPEVYSPVFQAYRDLWHESGRPGPPGRLGAASHAFVARSSQDAHTRFGEYIAHYMSRAAPPGAPRLDFETYAGPGGPALCGSPAEVVDKLGRMHERWGHDLHLLAIDIGGVPRHTVAEVTELVAAEVLPQSPLIGTAQPVGADA